MGCFNSKQYTQRNMTEMKPLRTRTYGYDRTPLKLGDELHISLFPQDIIVSFSIEGDPDRPMYVFKSATKASGDSIGTTVISDQILLSLMDYSMIQPRDSIVTYLRSEDFHIRIGMNQLTKYWIITNDSMEIPGFGKEDEPWGIMISDQHEWSTVVSGV